MRTYGADGMGAHIRRSVAIARGSHERVASHSDLFEIFNTPAFGLDMVDEKEGEDLGSCNLDALSATLQ